MATDKYIFDRSIFGNKTYPIKSFIKHIQNDQNEVKKSIGNWIYDTNNKYIPICVIDFKMCHKVITIVMRKQIINIVSVNCWISSKVLELLLEIMLKFFFFSLF